MIAFTPFPAPTGKATRLAQRISALSSAGYSLDVLTPKASTLPHVSKLARARILRVPMPAERESAVGAVRGRAGTPPATPRLTDLYAAFERAVRRQMESEEYDGVLVMDPSAASAVLGSRQGAKLLYEPGGDLPTRDDPVLTEELERRDLMLLESADAVFVPSEQAEEDARSRGATARRVHLLRPAVDLALFGTGAAARRRGASTLRVAVAAGQLRAEEISLLAEAVLILPASCELRVVVSAAVTDEERRAIQLAGPALSRLELREPMLYDDLVPFYDESDLGLVVSAGALRDKIPPARLQAVAELMAAGLAPVLPDLAAVREMVDHDVEALLVAPGDVEALVNALQAVAQNEPLRRRLGLAARKRAAAMHDERSAGELLVRICGRVMSRRQGTWGETVQGDDAEPRNDGIKSLLRTAWSAPDDRQGNASVPVTVAQRSPSRPNPSIASPRDDSTSVDGPAPPETARLAATRKQQ